MCVCAHMKRCIIYMYRCVYDFVFIYIHTRASQVVLVVKKLPVSAGVSESGLHPWVGKIPWKMAWQPTPVFLPGESHGQKSLSGYSP